MPVLVMRVTACGCDDPGAATKLHEPSGPAFGRPDDPLTTCGTIFERKTPGIAPLIYAALAITAGTLSLSQAPREARSLKFSCAQKLMVILRSGRDSSAI
jgi:hypothetical protein